MHGPMNVKSVKYSTKNIIVGTDGSGLQNRIFVNISTTGNVKEGCVESRKL
jgi:hypothetical protein